MRKNEIKKWVETKLIAGREVAEGRKALPSEN